MQILGFGEGATKCNGHFDLELMSLLSDEKLLIKGALIVSDFVDDQNTFPH